jgi:IS1 family transposase
MTGVSKGTIITLLEKIGSACAEFHDRAVRGVHSRRIQCDEIWQFCYAKAKNVPEDKRGVFGYGDVWTWTAVDADTKLTISYFIGNRDAESGYVFMHDLASRITNRVQLTTDGNRVYLEAVESAFGADIDFATLVKIYGVPLEGERRYSPPVCLGAEAAIITGNPDRHHISTSYVERSNLTMRMNMRRFTRLTNAFSKKVDNLRHAVALYAVHYNFCRIHQTLRVTPAQEAGIETRAWDVQDIVRLLPENREKEAA